MKKYTAKEILIFAKEQVKQGAPVSFHNWSETQLEFRLDIVQRERLNEETTNPCNSCVFGGRNSEKCTPDCKEY